MSEEIREVTGFSRRQFLKAIAVGAGGAVLVACTPVAPGALAPAQQAPAAEPAVTIYWSMFGLEEAAQAQRQVDRYNEETGDNAIFMSIGWGNIAQKVQIAIEGGNPPDMVSLWQQAYTWGPRGLLLPLEDYAERDGWDGAGWTPAAYQQLWSDGHLWGTGHTLNMRALHANATQYTEAGFSADTPPTEIAELDQIADVLTASDADGNLTRLGFLPWQGTNFFHWGWAFGGSFYDPETDTITCGSDEKIVEALAWYQSYAQKYDIEKIDRFRSGFGREHMSADDPWYVGKISMAIQGSFKRSWIPRYAPELEYFVSASPTVPGVPPVSEVAIGAMFNVPRGAKNPDGGWRLAKEFASKRCQIEFNKEVGNLPPMEEAANDPEYLDALPFAQVFIDVAASGGRSYPAMASLALYQAELNRAVDEVIHGVSEPEAALLDVQAKVQADLDAFRQQVAG